MSIFFFLVLAPCFAEYCVLTDNGFTRLCSYTDAGSPVNVTLYLVNGKLSDQVSSLSERQDFLTDPGGDVYCFHGSHIDHVCQSDYNVTSYNGDSNYCSLYNCSSTVTPCFCKIGFFMNHLSLPNGRDVAVQFISSTPGLELFRDLQAGSLPDDFLVNIRVDSDRFALTFPRFGIYHVVVKSRYFSDYFNTTSPYIEFMFPDKFSHLKYGITVDITLGSLSRHFQFYTTGTDMCQNLECLFCMSSYQGWDCLTWYEQMAIVLVLIVFFGLAALSIPCILFALYFMFMSIWRFFLFSKKTKNMVDTSKLSSDLKKLNPFRCCNRYVRSPSGYDTILTLSAILAVAYCCDSGISVPGVVQNCVTIDSMTQQCEIDFSLFLSLDNLGSIACITVVDSISSGTVMYTASITYSVNRISYSPFIWYYTSAWSFGYQTRTRCPATEDCSILDDAKCPHSASTANRDQYGELTAPNVNTYGGLSRCDRANIANGCFFPDPVCVFSGWWFIPNGPIQTVNNLGIVDYSVTITVDFDDGFNSGTVDIELTPGLTWSGGPSTITLENYVPISNLIGEAYPFALLTGTSTYLFPDGQVSLPSYPEVFKIGDIQASTTSAFTSSYSSIIFNNDLVEYAGYDGVGAHYSAQGSASANLLDVSLPLFYAGNLWDYSITSGSEVNTLTSISTNASFSNPIQLNIVVSGGVAYRTVTFSHITSSFNEVSGCYDCQTCAVASFDLASDGQSCSASVTSMDSQITILTHSVVISTNQAHDIGFCSSEQIGTATFHFTCGQSTTESTFDYILSAPVISLSDHYAQMYYGYADPISDSDSGFGLGLFDWLFEDHNLIFWLCLTIVLIVTIFLVLLCMWCCIQSCIASVPALISAGYRKSD